MTTTGSLDTAAAVLGFARTRRADAEAAETDLLQAAVQWAVLHPVDSILDAAVVPGTEGELAIAGPGAPLVGEFCVAEFAAALGMSTDAGRRLLGHAVELRYRLPRLYAAVTSGRVPAWKARRVAERTLSLPAEAAAYVDQHTARFAHTLGPVQLDRIVEEALARFLPAEAEARRQAAAEHRHFDIGLAHAGTTGVVAVDGVLDLADALDLEAAIATTARELADLGAPESLDVRRSMAVGEIARRDLTLDYPASPVVEEVARQESVPEEVAQRPSRRARDHGRTGGRSVVLHLHLTDSAMAGLNPVGRCGNTDTPVLTEQVRGWCGTAGRLTVKPVIDLAAHVPVDSYEVPDRAREQVDLRDKHCVFPHCRRRASRCDTDHVRPWPAGPTCPCNLAPLCRRHHRHKTHGGWTNTVVEPGTYRWTSPHGYRYLVDHTGTHDVSEARDPRHGGFEPFETVAARPPQGPTPAAQPPQPPRPDQ